MNREPRFDDYIEKAAPFAQPILKHVRERVHAVVPHVEEAMKWSAPGFTLDGKILLIMAAFKQHAALNFWRGQEIGDGEAKAGAMGQFGKLTSIDNLPPDDELDALIREAAELAKTAPAPRKTKHDDNYVIPLGASLQDVLKDPLNWDRKHGPGDNFFSYTNLNFPIVASIVERITGERFDIWMRRNVLYPTKLDACYNWPTCTDATVARAVQLDQGGKPVKDDLHGTRPACPVFVKDGESCDLARWKLGENGSLFSPQGGLRISARGLSRVGRMLLNGGELDGVRILSPRSVDSMQRVVGEELAKFAAIIEPKIRDGLARSMARRFDEKQLADINAFLATDTGREFGRQSMNLIWVWGHPEVYILVLPAFGIYSEVASTFSGKPLFGYRSMVFATLAICIISFMVWLHHFFTMGAGADINAVFGIASMIIGIPTGVKIYNWLFTMYGGRVRFTVPMYYTIGFML